jgi:hypothetical protein
MRPNVHLYLIVGGAAAIVLAGVWRFAFRHHQVTRLKRRLRQAPEPVDRARAGNQLIELGLRRAARVVLRTMPNETDDRVRLSIALGVARRQWEPSGARRVVELRRWAAEQVATTGHVTEFGPAVTRLADMGGPRLPPRDRGAPAPNGNGTPNGHGQPNGHGPPNGQGPPTEPSVPSVVGADPGVRWIAPTDHRPT